MRILVSGSTGLIGSALCGELREAGHDVLRLVRGEPGRGTDRVRWDPGSPAPFSEARLNGLDAVVHLAGESIAQRWTESRRRRIRESRVTGTANLVQALAALETPPRAFVSASGVHAYGDTGTEIVDESAPRGDGFLADVVRDWEAGAAKAGAFGARVAHARFGMVLSARGGALAQLLLPFRLGLGGRVGGGNQRMSWITLEDAARALRFLAESDVAGPFNVVAPGTVTNRQFAKALGRAVHRPAVVPLPAIAVRLLFGEMGETLLLGSVGARPAALEQAGFTFRHPEIDGALEAALQAGGD